MTESCSRPFIAEFRSVTKLYGRVLGVNDISLKLPAGAWGLLGPNGAGKSTLLNLLTGQLLPTRGTVRVLGRNPRNNADLLRRVGYCPGFEGLYTGVSGLDWLTFLLCMQDIPRKEARERAADCLALVGMTDAQSRPIASYSRGMRQRTRIAQAIAHDPELLILDEPFSGLDPVGRAEMTDVLRQRIASGSSLILASHVLHEIENVTRSFLLISGGRLLASGTTSEIHELLFDVPVEIRIRCSAPELVAGLAMQHGLADSVILRQGRCGERLVHVATRKTAELCARLPAWAAAHGICIEELQPADDSLQSLFGSLMKIHRGEMSA